MTKNRKAKKAKKVLEARGGIEPQQSEKITPSRWLEDEMPFLFQFLESNRRLFDFNVYGISAQGGDYKNVDQLTPMTSSDRILVVGDGVTNPHDLTELLIWLMR